MSNFSDYIKEENNRVEEKIDKTKKQNYEEMINKYSSYSKNDLMSEFIKITLEKKKKGELSISELNNLKSTILPFLNSEQKENLDKILQMVENV